MNKRIVLLGAYSAIVFETARLYAAEGAIFVLLGRNSERLQTAAQDLLARGATAASVISGDLGRPDGIQNIFEQVVQIMPEPELVLLGYGILGVQSESQADSKKLIELIEVNFTSAAIWCEKFAAMLESKKSGTLAVITSVAGDRGRKSNYAYGSTKAALSTYLQGMRNRLSSSGVQILTIKPGFVDTPMTAGMKKGLLFASAANVACGIKAAVASGKDVVYLPWFWRFILLIICAIPEKIFKRLSI